MFTVNYEHNLTEMFMSRYLGWFATVVIVNKIDFYNHVKVEGETDF